MAFLRYIKFSFKIIFRKISFPYQIPEQNKSNLALKLT